MHIENYFQKLKKKKITAWLQRLRGFLGLCESKKSFSTVIVLLIASKASEDEDYIQSHDEKTKSKCTVDCDVGELLKLDVRFARLLVSRQSNVPTSEEL